MNAAERLLNIYDKLVAYQADTSMTHAWAYVFELDNKDPTLEDAAIKFVIALKEQLDSTSKKLINEKSVPSNLMNPGFKNLRNVAAPTFLNSSWHSLRGSIQPSENRLTFTWAAFILRDDIEDEISDEEISELLEEILNFEDVLKHTPMSAFLRDFLELQIESIKNSLMISKVTGKKAIKESIEKFAGSYAVNSGTLDEEVSKSSEQTKTIFSKFGQIVKKTAEHAGNVDKLITLGKNLKKGYDFAEPILIEFVNK